MGLPLADQERGSMAYRCNWVVIKMLEILASGVLLLDLNRLLWYYEYADFREPAAC